MKSQHQRRRNERKEQLNRMFSVLPPFCPKNDYTVHLINHSTSTLVLFDLIQLARRTTAFTIDTEQDYYSHRPALIQIELIGAESVVILIEVCHLPHPTSVTFWMIRAVFKAIFQLDNVILSWGDIIEELSAFVIFGLFTSDQLTRLKTIDVQHRFKSWYNRHYPHGCGLPIGAGDQASCTCPYRPIKHENHRWSLQKAVAYQFDEFLDKSRTKSNWSRSLYSSDHRHTALITQRDRENRELVAYAANDCLAVTKLFFSIMDDGEDDCIDLECIYLVVNKPDFL